MLPDGSIVVRAWDKAISERSEEKKNPDFTASIGMAKDRTGNLYLFGKYHPLCRDPDTNTYGRFCKGIGDRDQLILEQARMDGCDTIVVLPRDPAQSGIVEFNISSAALAEHGFVVQQDPFPSNKAKEAKFKPFATLCQSGVVFILRDTFDDNTYESMMKELERFDGTPSFGTVHDDWCDAISAGCNYLMGSTSQATGDFVSALSVSGSQSAQQSSFANYGMSNSLSFNIPHVQARPLNRGYY